MMDDNDEEEEDRDQRDDDIKNEKSDGVVDVESKTNKQQHTREEEDEPNDDDGVAKEGAKEGANGGAKEGAKEGVEAESVDEEAERRRKREEKERSNELMEVYFYWKHVYETETRTLKRKRYESFFGSLDASAGRSSKNNKRVVGADARRECFSQIDRIVCPCIRCGSPKGMVFKKELFHQGRSTTTASAGSLLSKKNKDENKDANKDEEEGLSAEEEEEGALPAAAGEETKKETVTTRRSGGGASKKKSAAAAAAAAMVDALEWPNCYIYSAKCLDRQKSCLNLELYSGEVSDFVALHREKQSEFEQIERRIVSLKLDTMFQYISPNESVATFQREKRRYEESRGVYEGCAQTVSLLSSISAERRDAKCNIRLFKDALKEHVDQYVHSSCSLARELDCAVQTEQELYAEMDRFLLMKYRDMSMSRSSSSSSSSTQLVKVPVSTPPTNCVLHDDPPRILHYYRLAVADGRFYPI